MQPIIITRVFNAPREKVWQAWSDQTIAQKWYSPVGFTSPFFTIDFRVGGKALSCMRGAPGPNLPVTDFWSTGTYKEIIPLEKIVCTDDFADEKGNVVPASHYGMENMVGQAMVTVTFKDLNGQTEMTLHHSGVPESVQTDCTAGWNGMFDKLDALLGK